MDLELEAAQGARLGLQSGSVRVTIGPGEAVRIYWLEGLRQ